MSQAMKSKRCKVCRQLKSCVRVRPNHVLHAILSLFTAGLWLPVWALIGLLGYTAPWRCSTCGSKA